MPGFIFPTGRNWGVFRWGQRGRGASSGNSTASIRERPGHLWRKEETRHKTDLKGLVTCCMTQNTTFHRFTLHGVTANQIHWERHVTNLELYGGLPRVSTKIRARRPRLAGHCLRHAELAANKLVLWAPTQGHCSRGRPQTTYVDTLCRDSGLRREELHTAMEDQRVWRAIIRCSASTEWNIYWYLLTMQCLKSYLHYCTRTIWKQ